MTDWGPPPERGDDLEPERAKLRVKLALREEVRSLLREMLPAKPDLRGEVQAALRELLRDPVVAKALQGPPGQSVVSGGGSALTIGGVPVHSLAAGSGVTLTASAGTGTVAAGAPSGMVQLRKFTLTNAEMQADISEGTLIAEIYTLQPGDWLLLAQGVITEGFDDSGSPNFEIDTWNGANTSTMNVPLGPGATDASNGRLGADVGITTWGDLDNVNPITPSASALTIQVRAAMNGDGQTGSLTVLLWVAEF